MIIKRQLINFAFVTINNDVFMIKIFRNRVLLQNNSLEKIKLINYNFRNKFTFNY